MGIINFFRALNYNVIVPLFAGVGISIISAYYSILGLVAIFPATPIAIMTMGSALELGKVVTASYLYRNWKKLPILVRGYFIAAVIVLMAITSMGTFGFLSKAHIQNTSEIGSVQAQIERIDTSIQRETVRLNRAQTSLDQLDAAINSMIGQEYASRGLTVRRSQAVEREALQTEITQAETAIDQFRDDKIPLVRRVQEAQTEVGPIRYVAELFYGSSESSQLEMAVRWMIILLVIVFDPLAVLLIMMSTGLERPKEPEVVKPKKKKTRRKIVKKVDPTKIVRTTNGTDSFDMNVSLNPETPAASILNKIRDNS